METRLFYTDGNRNIIEESWDKPDPVASEIEVKSIFTGVCRSDIDMHTGAFQLLPKTIQGHESLGVVTKVGLLVNDVKEGDFVATRGEPAFADYYNCLPNMYVRVPSADPKYILEPVACGINIANSMNIGTEGDILLLGSGFLATIVYTIIRKRSKNCVVVVGSANHDFWKTRENVTIITNAEEIRNKKFDHIIDLSDKPEYLDLNIYNERAIIVMAAEKHPKASTSFAQFLWNAVDMKFPSPRNSTFYDCMRLAESMVRSGELVTDTLWTKAYDRDTEVKLAFDEGIARPAGYSRGYIRWQK
jgi:D-arabinose 1-dehydrogenase-like Zn-dependent alcohol dehydrogenase